MREDPSDKLYRLITPSELLWTHPQLINHFRLSTDYQVIGTDAVSGLHHLRMI